MTTKEKQCRVSNVTTSKSNRTRSDLKEILQFEHQEAKGH